MNKMWQLLLMKLRLSEYPLSWAKDKTDFEQMFLMHKKDILSSNFILLTAYVKDVYITNFYGTVSLGNIINVVI